LGKAKQGYAHSIQDVNGDWDELRKNFSLAFFSPSQVNTLRIEILTFQQKEETLGAAWARFTSLKNTGPDLSLPDHVLLNHFHHGLSKEAAFHLDLSSGGSFTHMSFSEREAILQKILENTPYMGIYDEFPEEEKENESSPEPKEEEYATESNFFLNPSNNLIATPRQEKEVLIAKSQQLQSQDLAIDPKLSIPQNPPRE
jgi:hypothetical protein